MAAATLGLHVTRFFTRVQRSRSNAVVRCARTRDPQCDNCYRDVWSIRCNEYAKKACVDTSVMVEDSGAAKPKKKKVFIPRVTLLSENDEMSVVTLEMAQKISLRRSLKLVKVLDFDTKTERPIYKLMTSKQYIQEELEVKKRKKLDRETALKPEKFLSMSTKISEHDLQTKLKSIAKLLSKKHEIRILISVEENKEKAEEIATVIRTSLKDFSPTFTKSSSKQTLRINLTPNLNAETPKDSAEEINDETVAAPST